MVRNYDECMRPFERRVFGEARARLVATAVGRVLDVGAGTGANFAHYGDAVHSVVAVDPELEMLERAAPKGARSAATVHIVAASAEELPFPDESFDTVVATLVFCTIADPGRALGELERVMAHGGRILMLEHVRSSSRPLALLQDVATPIQRVIAAGCHLNRQTRSLVERSGLRIDAVRERYLGVVVELEATRATR